MDLYEFTDTPTGESTPTPGNTGPGATTSSVQGAPGPSLEEEVTQVFGQINRFWGGFKRQSVSAFEVARKDIGQRVGQAREEIGKFATPESTTITRDNSGATEAGPSSSASTTTEEVPTSSSAPSDKGKQAEDPSTGETTSDTASTTPTQPSFNAFFSRLQHSLPPQLAPGSISQTLQTIQKQIQPTLANASTAASQAAAQASQAASNVDMQQIRTSLSMNIQRMQDAPLVAQAEKLAEEYRHKSEVLLKEAGEYLKDAVKVVPPDGSERNILWDGSDVWMYPSPIGTAGWGGSEEAKPRPSGEISYARVKRADALLARLKRDPEMLRLDPSKDATVEERYETYVKEEIEDKGGLDGELWIEKIKEALAESESDGEVLKATRDSLVPSEMTNEEFWNRYFFRVFQIQDEEEKRQALIAGAATQKDEDFSWDDDDEDSPKEAKGEATPEDTKGKDKTHYKSDSSASAVAEPLSTSVTTLLPPKEPHENPASGPSSSAASPRESEESYDVVSAGMNSKDASSDDSDWE
ncbi:hypothetical protein FRB99_006691 [Tulasnella sp. 403]|nr:hypothetical protein FRB99_006691 [Tulasnella sp. 403]